MELDISRLAKEGEFIALDVEGDGNDYHRAVEISLVRFRQGVPCEEFHWMINPGRPISSYVSKLHGITDDMVAECPFFSEIQDEIVNIIEGSVVVAHSIRDDMKILRQDITNIHQLPSLRIDTLRLAKNVLPGRAKYGLQSLVEMLQMPPLNASDFQHPVFSNAPDRVLARHAARYDAMICGKSFVALCGMIPPSPRVLRHISNSVIIVAENKMFEPTGTTVGSEGTKPPKL